jgi:hypothetical protein
MWLQEPGSFTRIIAAMVAPRNTSSETIRVGRPVSAAGRVLDEGAAMVSAVAMVGPPMARIVQQQWNCSNGAAVGVLTKKRGREGCPGHALCQREETFAISNYRLRFVRGFAAVSGSPNI